MARRNYSNTAAPTSLSSAIISTTTSFSVASLAGYPSSVPFVIALERGTANEELCLVTAVASNTVTVTRGYGGTQAVGHAQGVAVEHVASAEDYDDANAHIWVNTRDDHPQYLNASRHNALSHASVVAPMNLMPVGALVAWAGSSVPGTDSQWLLCNGQSVSRTTFSALFAVLGTTYGAGDGSTTFTVPDLRGRAPVGVDGTSGSSRVPGASTRAVTGGAASVTLAASHLPSHSHTVPSHSHTGTTAQNGAHFHGAPTGYGFFGAALRGTKAFGKGKYTINTQTNGNVYLEAGTTNNGKHNHAFTTSSTGLTTNAAGGGQQHENMPPYQTVFFIIRAKP
jgi:microcystin-dependent protein